MKADLIDLAGKLVGSRGVLSILAFHQVLLERDPLAPDIPDVAEFQAIAKLLSERVNVLRLSEAVERLRQGSLPPRAVCITFDDGYANNIHNALPVLAEYGLVAAFFLTVGMLGGGIMWNDRIIESVRRTRRSSLDLNRWGLGVKPVATSEEKRAVLAALIPMVKHMPIAERNETIDQIVELCDAAADLPADLMMRNDDVPTLVARGMEVGGHTLSHPILARIDETHARREIFECRERLTALVRQPVQLFAYPNGKPGTDYTRTHVEMVRNAGFSAAVTTSWGVCRQGDDVLQLPRFTPWGAPGWRFLYQMYRNYSRQPVVA